LKKLSKARIALDFSTSLAAESHLIVPNSEAEFSSGLEKNIGKTSSKTGVFHHHGTVGAVKLC
jgi:hypothetical protein